VSSLRPLNFPGGAGVNELEIYVQAFGDDDPVANTIGASSEARKVWPVLLTLESMDSMVRIVTIVALWNRDGDGLRRRRRRWRRRSRGLFWRWVMKGTRSGIRTLSWERVLEREWRQARAEPACGEFRAGLAGRSGGFGGAGGGRFSAVFVGGGAAIVV